MPAQLSARAWAHEMRIEVKAVNCVKYKDMEYFRCTILGSSENKPDKFFIVKCFYNGDCDYILGTEI